MIIQQKDIFFHEIGTSEISGSTVILDIDGTLTCSSKKEIDKNVIEVIRALQQKNVVYVFSNNYDGARSREIAKSIDLPYIESPHKKPSKKILTYIDETCPVVAIGDKYLTDGLFAQFIGAQHIRVKRYKCKDDSIADKLACLFDDVIYAIAQFLNVIK
jgi:predicted HAD superfamily phosphohydrolase YqeG